jgi:DNA polymerase-3 subunit delta
MKPEDLERSVSKGEISPLYFIYGEEEFLADRAVNRLVEKLVDPAFRDFNFTVLYGKECKAEQILDNAMTLPMFAERRVILVKRAEELQAEQLEQLIPYIKAPSPETCLVFHASKIDLRRKFFTELKKTDLLIEYKKLKDDQLAGFVRREAEVHGKRIDPAAADLLVYYCGNSLREIVAQVEKLATYVGKKGVIAVDDVKAIVSDTKTDTVFELANALGSRNLDKSARQLQILLRDADAPFMLVGALARHFRQLCMIRELMDKKVSQDEISKQVKINPYFLKGMISQAQKFRMDEYRKIFLLLHETDLGLKSGGRQGTLFEMLLFEICLKKNP